MRPTKALGTSSKAVSYLALIGLLGLSLVMGAAAPLSVARDDQQGATPSRGAVTLSPARGPIGSMTTLRGNGFAANATLDVLWQDWNGSWDARGGGFKAREYKEQMVPLTQVRADASGAFEAPTTCILRRPSRTRWRASSRGTRPSCHPKCPSLTRR